MTSQSAPQRRANLYQRPMVARLEADGSAVFMVRWSNFQRGPEDTPRSGFMSAPLNRVED